MPSRKSCVAPTPPVSTESSEYRLVLAPVDRQADAALGAVLNRSGLSGSRHDECVIALTSDQPIESALAVLRLEMRPALQRQIRASVWAHHEPLSYALVRSEPLPKFFDILESRWIQDTIAQSGLRTVFHPIMSFSGGSPVAYEALMRGVRVDTGQEVGPARLIYAAKQTGCLQQLDTAARSAAIQCAGSQIPANSLLFTNFFAESSYGDDDAVPSAVAACQESGITPSRVVIEVVEAEFSGDWNDLDKLIRPWREAGFRIALDDLTGSLNSIECMVRLSPDFVKLDLNRFEPGTQPLRGSSAVEGLLHSARNICATVIAEGIETEDAAYSCASLGIDWMQGYWFARPSATMQTPNSRAAGLPLAA